MPKDDPNQFLETQDNFEMNIKTEDPNDKLIIPNQPTEFDSENQGQSQVSSFIGNTQIIKKGPKKQNFRDNLILGPIDKYVRYGLFPYKFMIHLTLLFLTASQVLMIIKPETDYSSDT